MDMQFHTVTTKPEVPPKVWETISQATNEEEHLLETAPDVLQQRYKAGLSMLGFTQDEVIFHTGLTPLVRWYELGGTWTHTDWRGQKINQKAYAWFLPKHEDKMILITTTGEVSLRVGTHFGFVTIPRSILPPDELAATCICRAHKTGSQDPRNCLLAWSEPQQTGLKVCYVRITPQTAARLSMQAAA